jgi:hypothetical protein
VRRARPGPITRACDPVAVGIGRGIGGNAPRANAFRSIYFPPGMAGVSGAPTGPNWLVGSSPLRVL